MNGYKIISLLLSFIKQVSTPKLAIVGVIIIAILIELPRILPEVVKVLEIIVSK